MQAQLPQQREEQKRQKGVPRAEKGVTDGATLARYQHAWDHAADRTPHGEPIELQPQDFHDHN